MQILVGEGVVNLNKLSLPETKNRKRQWNQSSKILTPGDGNLREVTFSKFFKQLETLNNYS
jgi:hypothetical protein